MTTTITVDAHAGWPVDVTSIDTQNGSDSRSTERVPAYEKRNVYVYSGRELLIREVPRDGDLQMAPGASGDFGWALFWLKRGLKVARKGWNGKGMWVALSWPKSEVRNVEASLFWSEHTKAFAESKGGVAKVQPYIIMKTAADELQSGWLASQSDMLADDWEIVQ